MPKLTLNEFVEIEFSMQPTKDGKFISSTWRPVTHPPNEVWYDPAAEDLYIRVGGTDLCVIGGVLVGGEYFMASRVNYEHVYIGIF